MRSVQFKSKSNERLSNNNKSNAGNKQTKNVQGVTRVERECQSARATPSDCSWVPSRDWHEYLSAQGQGSRQPLSVAKDIHSLRLEKPPDELVFNLPKVNFCSQEKAIKSKEPPIRISDLCDEDKRKIANLVEELARCKEDKQKDEETIVALKNKVSQIKSSLKAFAEKKTEQKENSEKLNEEILKKQLTELNRLLLEMQVKKSSSDQQVRTVTSQAERMTRALHAMHRDNTELKVQLRVSEERLLEAQGAVDRLARELEEARTQARSATVTVSADKTTQTTDLHGARDPRVSRGTPRPQEDNLLLSELFFKKSLLADYAPKETIIFLTDPSRRFNSS